jgi:uncharacterized protein YciI
MLFAVVRSRCPAWKTGFPLEQQDNWDAHAAFMDALYAEGFVALAGPLEEASEVLMIIRAKDAGQIHARLAEDPWSGNLLRTTRVDPWTLRLGSLPSVG